MLLAQAFAEYGALSALMSSIENAWLSVEDQISRVDSSTWLVVGLIAVVLFVLWNRR